MFLQIGCHLLLVNLLFYIFLENLVLFLILLYLCAIILNIIIPCFYENGGESEANEEEGPGAFPGPRRTENMIGIIWATRKK